MKKKVRSHPVKKYNKLFKYLSFDQSLLSSLLITVIIILYAFAILGLFQILDIPVGGGEAALN